MALRVNFVILFVAGIIIVQVSSHGYMWKPVNRASRWRLNVEDQSVPHCYEDNQFYCGGINVQWNTNGGKCGTCGDDLRDPVPRSNENGGIYGNGVIVENYTAGSLIDIDIRLTANHLGNMSFQICNLDDDPSMPETEECFNPVTFEDGSYYLDIGDIGKDEFNITTSVILPTDLICERCVFRWHYVASNNWGDCGDGTFGHGCGPQETFRSCADISIKSSTSSSVEEAINFQPEIDNKLN